MHYYLFLDETGDHGLSFVDKNFPLFLLAGCLFEDAELTKIEKEINKFKTEFFKTTSVILHSRDIRKCDGPFQILFDLELKKKFYEKLDEIMSRANFTIIGSGVNKEEHIKKYGRGAENPYILSLSFIMERLIFCLDKKEDKSIADVQIEKRGRKEDQQLLNQYNKILDNGTYYVTPDRLKNKIGKFDSFLKRENIIGLQIADLCAYPLARHILNPPEPYPPFNIIKSKIYCDGNGKFDGYGLKIFP
ncbi:MAG: DUF3800 domain-containing protein [Candidatus Azambacteria bacterium]|nr:DUF3800 domain-containing protein [Candidatus Azambacteria bacterium]